MGWYWGVILYMMKDNDMYRGDNIYVKNDMIIINKDIFGDI